MVTAISPTVAENAPSATLLVVQRKEVHEPQHHPQHISLTAKPRLKAQNLWEFKKYRWWEGRTGKPSKARAHHLPVVSRIPSGTVTCSLARK